MQEISEEQIEKFLSGQCTEEEAAVVWRYLQRNPDDLFLLKEFERTDGVTSLPKGYREEMLAAITHETAGAEHTTVIGQEFAAVVKVVDGLPVEYLAAQQRRAI